jgi:hypothetical protein
MNAVLLKLSFHDRVGLRARRTGFCAEFGLDLPARQQSTDAGAGCFCATEV